MKKYTLSDGTELIGSLPFKLTTGDYAGTYPRNWLELATEQELSDRGITVEDLPEPAPTAFDVAAERERRLALGFDYDFGDARGTHHLATTDLDMKGWDEVTKWSQAAIALGNGTSTLDILTETGPCQVTANEWHQVLIYATSVRQPLWAASFVLQSQDPIPSDYTDDSYWQ